MPIPATKYIWFNGKLVPWEKATVHVLSHALHYGSSVFEGVRAYETPRGPAIFRLRDHTRRLFDSAKIYRINIPFNEDQLNQFSRKTFPDLLDAALRGTNQAYFEVARPTANLIVPTVSEHTMGQLLQMLMLATVVEGRLMNVNPYGQPGVEAYKKNMMAVLKASPNLPKGEVRDAAKGV